MSSGVLSFTNTGIYRVEFYSTFMNSGASNPRYCQNYVNYSTDSGGSYDYIGIGTSSISEISSGGTFSNTFISVHVDVTNTSTHRMQFQALSEEATSLRSNSDYARTYVAVIRLGDT
jgi:coproporphyrinogen III oxidase-like Fe-S oxidoreductase